MIRYTISHTSQWQKKDGTSGTSKSYFQKFLAGLLPVYTRLKDARLFVSKEEAKLYKQKRVIDGTIERIVINES